MTTLYTIGLLIWAALAQMHTSEVLGAIGLLIIAVVLVINADRFSTWVNREYDRWQWWRIWKVDRVQVGFVIAVG